LVVWPRELPDLDWPSELLDRLLTAAGLSNPVRSISLAAVTKPTLQKTKNKKQKTKNKKQKTKNKKQKTKNKINTLF
jgi:hypothetical protein